MDTHEEYHVPARKHFSRHMNEFGEYTIICIWHADIQCLANIHEDTLTPHHLPFLVARLRFYCGISSPIYIAVSRVRLRIFDNMQVAHAVVRLCQGYMPSS